MVRSVRLVAALLLLASTGCWSVPSPRESVRVGSYNIRLSASKDGVNGWEHRRGDLVSLIRKMDLDVLGLQEVCPDQERYLRDELPGFEFVGDCREQDRVSGEASPVAYRRDRFEVDGSGTFWLSETPEVPGSKGWDAACPRVCTYLVLRDKVTGRKFGFANTHTDHVGVEARIQGVQLIVRRMKEFSGGAPIVFTGDFNCGYDDAPSRVLREVLDDGRDVSETTPTGPRDTFQDFGREDAQDQSVDNCIDYIYVSSGIRVLDFQTYDDCRPGTLRRLFPSDHFPVSATIILPGKD